MKENISSITSREQEDKLAGCQHCG